MLTLVKSQHSRPWVWPLWASLNTAGAPLPAPWGHNGSVTVSGLRAKSQMPGSQPQPQRAHPTTAGKSEVLFGSKPKQMKAQPATGRTLKAEKEEEIRSGHEGEQRNSTPSKSLYPRGFGHHFAISVCLHGLLETPCITVFQSTFLQDEFNGLIKVTLCTNWEVSEASRRLSCIYTCKVPTAEQGRQFKAQKHPWVNYFLLVCHIFLRYDCSFGR